MSNYNCYSVTKCSHYVIMIAVQHFYYNTVSSPILYAMQMTLYGLVRSISIVHDVVVLHCLQLY